MAGHRSGFFGHCQFLPALESFPVDNSARHAVAWIMKVMEGSKKESSKYLRVQGGRVLYQFTVWVKLPKEASRGRYGF